MSKIAITYITNARIPTERAQGVQIVNTCAALAVQGADVELVVPWRYNALKADPYEYYNVPKNFRITTLFSLDLVWLGSVGFWLQEWSFAFSARMYVARAFSKKQKNSEDQNPEHAESKRKIYIRGERVFSGLASYAGTFPMYLESHVKPKDMENQKALFGKAKGVIVVTKYYEQELKKMGLNAVAIPDAVTISNFDLPISKENARMRLGLPLDKKIVMYTGHLYAWKGADTLAEAAKKLPEDVVTVFVGGSPEDLEPFKKRHADPKIIFTGIKPYRDIPMYLKAADVVVLPNTKKEDISVWYTSPIKLFEYMASNRPIVSSDLPSMREVLNESNAVFATPDNPDSFACAIKDLLDNPEKSEKVALRALKDVENYSWDKRAQKILEFISIN